MSVRYYRRLVVLLILLLVGCSIKERTLIIDINSFAPIAYPEDSILVGLVDEPAGQPMYQESVMGMHQFSRDGKLLGTQWLKNEYLMSSRIRQEKSNLIFDIMELNPFGFWTYETDEKKMEFSPIIAGINENSLIYTYQSIGEGTWLTLINSHITGKQMNSDGLYTFSICSVENAFCFEAVVNEYMQMFGPIVRFDDNTLLVIRDKKSETDPNQYDFRFELYDDEGNLINEFDYSEKSGSSHSLIEVDNKAVWIEEESPGVISSAKVINKNLVLEDLEIETDGKRPQLLGLEYFPMSDGATYISNSSSSLSKVNISGNKIIFKSVEFEKKQDDELVSINNVDNQNKEVYVVRKYDKLKKTDIIILDSNLNVVNEFSIPESIPGYYVTLIDSIPAE